MASTARLFILLAAAIPILALFNPVPHYSNRTKDLLCDFYVDILYRPPELRMYYQLFQNHPNLSRLAIMGPTSSSWSVGYASMIPPNYEIAARFNLWLPKTKTVDGRLNVTYMDHYIFEGWSIADFYFGDSSVTDKYSDWMIVTLYDRDARWSGPPNHLLCAVYRLLIKPLITKFLISKNESCHDLMKLMDQPVPDEIRYYTERDLRIYANEQTDVLRNKRSDGGGTRFHHESVLHENDHVDYNQENDDGKDAHAKTTGVEHYILRSQRHDPVGISGIDHSSSYVDSKKETNNEKKQNLKLN